MQINKITDLKSSGSKAEFYDILRKKAFFIHYQPIISLGIGDIFGFEALTRGPLNSYFYYPDRLFLYAENQGSLYKLEKITRELAIENSRDFLKKEQKLFINISSQVIYDPKFISGYTTALLEKYQLTPHNIIFEITERSAIKDFDAFRKVLEHYRMQGFKIAIDDAGAGYSSLQAISELNPEYIKIDRSLIQNIDKNDLKKSLVETLTNSAKKINSKVIAEGIETAEELHTTVNLGVQYGQGFFLARPNFPPESISVKAVECLANYQVNIERGSSIIRKKVEYFTASEAIFDIDTNPATIVEYFAYNQHKEWVVISKADIPVGILKKENLKHIS